MIAFAETGERLAMLHAGDAVSVAGKARLSQWEDAEGKPRAGLDVTVTEVISLQSASKAGFRKPRTVRPDRAEAESGSEMDIPFDDDLDFLDAGPAKADAEGVLPFLRRVSNCDAHASKTPPRCFRRSVIR